MNNRLKQIHQWKQYYTDKLKEEPSDLGKDLINIQLRKLTEEENEIRKRSII